MKELLILVFFFLKLLQYPYDSKPNSVACSNFELPFNCQKDTETAMRLNYSVHFGPNKFYFAFLSGFVSNRCLPLLTINFYKRSSKIILRDKQIRIQNKN